MQNQLLNMGFFYVKNHGISQVIIDDAFEASKKFFSEPIERKMLVLKDQFHRGYLPLGTTRYPGKAADLKAEIKFENGGVKKLLLRFAKLEIIS